MSISRGLPLAGSAVLLLAQAAPAATVASTEDEEMREVIVTARSVETSTPLELSTLGFDVEFINNEQVKRQGFVDVGQALEMMVPGAYVATQAGAFSYLNISLQGSRTADVLWTVDGVRINNRLYNSTSPADTLPASMIERMEVLKGGHGLLYGTQAAAGVINVVTKAFSDTPDGAVSLGMDSNNGVNANGYFRGALGGNKFVAWASKNKTDGYSLYDVYRPGSTTRDRHYDVDSFGLKYGFDFSDSLRLTLQGVHTEAALDYPSVTSTNVNDRNEEIVSGRLDYSPSERVSLYLKGYWHDWDTNYYPATNPAASAYWGYEDFGGSAVAQLDLNKGLQYIVGVDMQRYRGVDEVLLIEEMTEKVQAFYAQLRTTDDLSTKAHFTAGVRYNDTGGTDATVWSTSAVYRFSEAFYVEGSVGTSFLLPDAEQLFGVDPCCTHGNPDLEPEEAFNVNVAIGGAINAGSLPIAWQLSGWDRRVENLIAGDDTNPPAGFDEVYVNTDGEVKMTGAEILLRSQLTTMFAVDGSFMFSRERDPATGDQRPNRPLHSGKLGLTWEGPASPFGASLTMKYFGTTYSNAAGAKRFYGEDLIANLGVQWYPDAQTRHHRVGLRVENLFDTDYATSILATGGTSPPGTVSRRLGPSRTFFANYTYQF